MSSSYTVLANNATQNSLSWETDDIRAALLSNSISYTPDPDFEQFESDVLNGSTAAEFSGSNYSRKSLSGKTRSTVSPNEYRLDADDVNFGVLDGDTIQGVLIYNGVAGGLIAYLDGGDFPYTTDGTEDITISFPSNGIVVFDV
jgi:hypothetical protein